MADFDDAALFSVLIDARASRGELALLGLSREALGGLLARHRPGAVARAVDSPDGFSGFNEASVPPAAHAAFVAALRERLMGDANPAVDADDARCLATIIAHACLRPDHLWRDLGLSGRDAASAMLARYFPALVARNTANLRWKKFFARDLALARGDEPAPAPGCPGCEDYLRCFPGDGFPGDGGPSA
ncbi:nitrogen fixation protein NifQ [Burkholderia plantarii]|uniref:nitrogen fixation protein NifQ n=1 Tax=Burkholderia plantarii TaxID=41899 RepID=UPI0018DB2BDA|nr:nitrogen fixation protein NifQ [Burkholderia plantarii]MBI0330226.1 nitrogen fixation protein NifQ [Burkholderia plantarii]